MFSTLPAIFYTSLKAHDKNLNKKEKAYFKEIVGMDFDDFMLVDLLNRNIPETKPTDFNNLSFVFLYNDLLQGLFDEAVPNDSYNLYNETAKKLNKNCKNKEFGYLFKSLKDLSNVLKYKADLGKSIYNHYKDGDVDGLKNDVSIIIKSKQALKQLMKNYEVQWLTENKSFGYEKHNIRFGGLLERLNYTQLQLTKYINKDIDKIDELVEEHLPISALWWNHNHHQDCCYHNYQQIVSSGMLKEI